MQTRVGIVWVLVTMVAGSDDLLNDDRLFALTVSSGVFHNVSLPTGNVEELRVQSPFSPGFVDYMIRTDMCIVKIFSVGTKWTTVDICAKKNVSTVTILPNNNHSSSRGIRSGIFIEGVFYLVLADPDSAVLVAVNESTGAAIATVPIKDGIFDNADQLCLLSAYDSASHTLFVLAGQILWGDAGADATAKAVRDPGQPCGTNRNCTYLFGFDVRTHTQVFSRRLAFSVPLVESFGMFYWPPGRELFTFGYEGSTVVKVSTGEVHENWVPQSISITSYQPMIAGDVVVLFGNDGSNTHAHEHIYFYNITSRTMAEYGSWPYNALNCEANALWTPQWPQQDI